MKKSTTLLTLAGVLALTGCTTKVMDDRYYETPKDESGKPIQLNAVPNPRPMPAAQEKAPLQNKKGSVYTPMEVQELDNAGIDDNAAPKGKAKKDKAASGKAVAAAGTYVVQKNDTLGKIARKHHVSLAALMSANNLTDKDARRLYVGKKLVIPGGKGVKAVKAAPVKGKAKGKKGTAAPAAASAAGLNPDGTYTVRRGDNIPKIARKFGVRARALQDANNLSDEATRKIQIGQKLVIPAGGKAAAAAPKAAVKTEEQPKQEPQQQAAPAAAVQPPPAAVDSTTVNAAPPAAQDGAAAAPANNAAPDSGAVSTETATDFVSVGDAKTLEEFAAKNGTTVEKLRQLNASYANTDKLEPGSYIFVPRK